jgi:predicted ATP-dependent endonuclease of OLD family
MQVKNIELRNFKTISDFSANFEGGIYLITGENEVGKSTLLNAIATLLTGERSSNLLKIGEEQGHAKMTVGDYEVEIKFNEKNPRGTITVTTAEGMKSNNISTLQSIFQYQDFDAHDFVQWSNTAEGRRKQVKAVKSLLPDTVISRIEELDTIVKDTKELRAVTNKNLSEAEIVLKQFAFSPESVEQYKEPLILRDLFDQKNKVEAQNREIQDVQNRTSQRELEVDKMEFSVSNSKNEAEKEIQELKNRIDFIEKQKEEFIADIKLKKIDLSDKITAAQLWLKKNQETNVSEITEKINNAEEHNEKHREITAYQNQAEAVKKLSGKFKEQDEKVTEALEERQALVASCKLPIEGLTFTEDGLFLNGVPFAPDEVSTSQEMEVAAKLIIAKNPKVKVFRIAQGESLGKARLESIVKFATENGYQGFIEEVRRGQDTLVVESYTIKE